MKSMLIFILAISMAWIIIPAAAYAGSNPDKYALIIAVADYPEEGRWPDISSDQDVPLIQGALLKQGFREENIRVILDEQASKQLIVKEIEELTQKVKPGDVVVIHYSGHGQQIEDDNGDELDGWDEAIIPWDAQVWWSDTYQGQNHLRDDEVKALTDQVRSKLGPDGSLLLILDACHSGTANRGLGKSRGTFVKFSREGYTPEEKADQGNFGDLSGAATDNMAPMVTISGASQHELNYEYYDREQGKSFGSLSYAFSHAMTMAGAESTYRTLFDMIKVKMSTIAPRQSPQVEGQVDYGLFGGNIVKAEPYYMVTEVWDDQNVGISTGYLMGVYDSSEVAFYPIGTYDVEKTKPLVTGTVIYSMAIEADVVLSDKIDPESIRNTWVYVTKQNFGDNNLNVRLDITNNAEMENKLKARFQQMPKIKLVDQNPDLVIEVNNEFTRGNNLQVITSDEYEIYFTSIGATTVMDEIIEEVVQKINHYMQVNLLKKIETHDESIDVSFEIIPVSIRKVGRRYEIDQRLDLDQMRNAGNELEFGEEDYFIIKVANNGYKRAYFQILDIRPNNEVTMLYPSPEDLRPSSEFVVDAFNETELDAIFFFEKPYGNEFLKLIATDRPIDLRSIIKSKGADTRGAAEMSPFEQLLQDSYEGTRAGALSMPPGSVTVFTVPIKVVGK